MRALATTCAREALPEEQAPLGKVCPVNSPEPARLPGLCHAGRHRAEGWPGGHNHIFSSTGLEEHLRQGSSGFGDGQLSGEGGCFESE